MTSPIDISSDGHVHTRLCHHARGEMEEYVEAALQRGLSEIIFLEHFEAGISYFESTWLTEEDFAYYHREGLRLREKFKDSINIGIGVEIGYNPDHVAETVQFLEKYQWDRVGLSYHFLKAGNEYVNVVSRRQSNLDKMQAMGLGRVAETYFTGLLQALAAIPADVVCHLDAVLRHHPDLAFSDEHYQLMRAIFRLMLQKDIALEVNTSGFAIRNEAYPTLSLVQEAHRMGIRLVAGSDAHKPDDVGRYFGRLPGLLA